MSDEVLELYGVAEIIADGVAKVHMIGNVIRLCFWRWERSEDGTLHKVCAGKLFITKEGLIASRPQTSAALGESNPNIQQRGDAMTAH